MHRHGQRGVSLIELITALAIIGICLLVALPAFANLRRRNAIRAASLAILGAFRETRARAIARNRYTAVKFVHTTSGEWQYTIYEDGNDNGVHNAEIASGIDRRISGPFSIEPLSRLAMIGLPDHAILDPDGDQLPPTASPVAFGTSSLCSFSAIGSASAGSIYLTDRAGEVYAVRVHAAGSRVRMLRYDEVTRKWNE